MGFISRKLFPACESMCVCCPALRSRSRQPVERYKKLLAEIFPKSLDSQPNERKIVKLCEYAAKNPFRIPKIAKYLEERCFKELRSEHIKFINIVTEAYCKMLCLCKQQMACFAISVLNVISELLNKPKQKALLILGCQTLTRFIYSQADGTYTHNIEDFVPKICKFALDKRDEVNQTSGLRMSGLQCLSAMVWFMAEFSYIFDSFDEIVYAILDNYKPDAENENDDERREQHNWVDEVVRCEGRCAIAGSHTSSSFIIVRPRPEKKDPSLLTREEIENSRVWAQICIQRLVEMAKESTTMRLVLDPMFVYFDSGRHWVPRQGLAMIVLSEMSYFLETSGNYQFVLAAIVRHLDHKNVAHDPQLKSYVVQVAANLARQIRSAAVLADIGFISDLLKHLRKSVQATAESVGEQESNSNVLLQNSIEVCLHEIVKGLGDASPLFDTMALALDKLPSASVVAHATIGSLTILSHAISLLPASTRLQQVFPEALLDQLLKAMLHPDIMVRVGAHQIFSVLLTPNSNHVPYETKNWRAAVASASDSISALLQKLRNEKDSANTESYENNILNGCKERDSAEDDRKQVHTWKNSPNVYTISSILDRTSGTSSLAEAEPCIMKFTEDQIAQLLSAFWIQATLPDNMPSNIEAIAHSFVLVLISFQMKWSTLSRLVLLLQNPNDGLLVRFFQLALSLRNLCLDPTNGILIPAGRRAVFVLSTGMLMFAAKIYQIPDLNDSLEKYLSYDVDPFLGIGNDLQVHVKPQADVRNFGSASDNQLATSLLVELQSKIFEDEKSTLNILTRSLSGMIEMEVDDVVQQLSEPFTPDEAFMFGHQPILERDQNQMVSYSKESLSFDEDIPANSTAEDDVTSEASVADMSRFIPNMPASPSVSHIISIGQLLESALQVAGQVAGTSVSTSPLPYDTMARQCEALGVGTRKKLSNWLVHENYRASNKILPPLPANGSHISSKITSYCSDITGAANSVDPCLGMRLPPASPFDNFLKAAGC